MDPIEKLEQIGHELTDLKNRRDSLKEKQESEIHKLEAEIGWLGAVRKDIKRQRFFSEGESSKEEQVAYLDSELNGLRNKIEAAKTLSAEEIRKLDQAMAKLKIAYVALAKGILPRLFEDWAYWNRSLRTRLPFDFSDDVESMKTFLATLTQESRLRQSYITTMAMLIFCQEVDAREIEDMERAIQAKNKERRAKSRDLSHQTDDDTSNTFDVERIKSSVLGSL